MTTRGRRNTSRGENAFRKNRKVFLNTKYWEFHKGHVGKSAFR
jgi:hypothetical protein